MDVNNQFYYDQFAGFVDEGGVKCFTGEQDFFNILGLNKKKKKKLAENINNTTSVNTVSKKAGGLFGKRKKAKDTKKKADGLKEAAEIKQLELQNATTDLDIAKKTAEAKALMNSAIAANKVAAKAEVEAVEAEAVATPEEKAAVVNAGLDSKAKSETPVAEKSNKTWYYVGGGAAALLLIALLLKGKS
jgi:hypothetical protein